MFDWIMRNKEWLFSGAGVVILAALFGSLRKMAHRRSGPQGQAQVGGANSQNFQVGRDFNINVGTPTDVEQEPKGSAADQTLESMSPLISDMRTDITEHQAEFVREFFVLPNRRGYLGGSSKPRFVYYEQEHDNLRGMLDVLEERGYIVDVTPAGNNVPIYRMTDKLVRHLLGE